MPDTMTTRKDLVYLDGPYPGRETAWTACRRYAAILVERGLTPTWGVEVRAITPGSTQCAVYLRSEPPGQDPKRTVRTLRRG